MTLPNSPKPQNPPAVRRGPSLFKKSLLWTRTLHIYFSTLALLMLLFFAMTGFMMNHEDFFGVDNQTTTEIKDKIPDAVLNPKPGGPSKDLAIVEYLRKTLGARGEVDVSGINEDPGRVTFKGPHYSFDVEIEKADGSAKITKTADSFSGWITNLHKGSDTGEAWHRIIDATSILLAFVSLTGLILWLSLAKRRTLGIISLAICVIVVGGMFWFFVP